MVRKSFIALGVFAVVSLIVIATAFIVRQLKDTRMACLQVANAPVEQPKADTEPVASVSAVSTSSAAPAVVPARVSTQAAQ